MNKFLKFLLFAGTILALAAGTVFGAQASSPASTPQEQPLVEGETPSLHNFSSEKKAVPAKKKMRSREGRENREPHDPRAPENPENREPIDKNFHAMAMLFSMSDAELERYSAVLERVKKIPETQRKQMAAEFQRLARENDKNRQHAFDKMRSRFQKEERNILERYLATLDEKTAKSERRAFIKMSPPERHDYMKSVREKLGLPQLPPPPPGPAPDEQPHDDGNVAPHGNDETADDGNAVPAVI